MHALFHLTFSEIERGLVAVLVLAAASAVLAAVVILINSAIGLARRRLQRFFGRSSRRAEQVMFQGSPRLIADKVP